MELYEDFLASEDQGHVCVAYFDDYVPRNIILRGVTVGVNGLVLLIYWILVVMFLIRFVRYSITMKIILFLERTATDSLYIDYIDIVNKLQKCNQNYFNFINYHSTNITTAPHCSSRDDFRVATKLLSNTTCN